jgi:hypothetical protein
MISTLDLMLGSTTWMEGKLSAHALSPRSGLTEPFAREHVALRELPCRSLSARSTPHSGVAD